MATDYSILEQELTELKTKLERELHMHNVRRLCIKQQDLAKDVVQRKQIGILSKEATELEAIVSTVYCPQHSLKDYEIMGYLVYLLKVKDFFTREVATKEERLNQLNLQTKMELRKFCVITREQAKIIKNKPRHSPEFVLLENMSNRMEQMNKCISKMRQENKEIMENVINMMKFQQQFTKFEKDFRRKINYLKGRGQELLEKAVFSYEEKDEFVAKQKVFEDRRSQDLRKTAITENALNLSLQRMEKNDKFAELQGTMRIDNRIAEASDMIEKGITGLEPGMEGMQNLQTAISAAAGEDTPEKMEESFRKSGDNIDMALSYLDEILKEINHLQGEINRLKKEIKQLTKSMSFSDRKFRKEIELSQDVAQKKLEEADEASKSTEEARNELNSAFDIVKQLYTSCCPDDAHSLEQIPIDETNVIDYLQKMEKKLLDYLICNEYMRMKEASEDDKPVILEEDKDEDIEDEVQEIERVGIVQPRTLLSETDLHSVREVDTDTETQFLQFEALKERAVAEIQSGKSGDETDASE